MKPALLLLAASLIANIAFVAVLATNSGSKNEPTARAESGRNDNSAKSSASADALRAALISGDASALEAAGVPAATARELSLGRTFSRLAEKVKAAQAKTSGDGRWWRNRPGAPTGSREQQLVAKRELSDALRTAFGDDLGLSGGDSSQLAFLPETKRDALRHIVQDYDEMFAKFGSGGIQLASDKEKLRLLRLERDRDIAALLTPEERTAYEMRTSATGALVRNRYGEGIESEAEFQKIYALQKAFDDKFPREALSGRITPEVMRARSDGERQLESEIKRAVGDERYAALRRAADPDFRTLDSLAQRLNLPSATADNVLASRDTYATESQRIANDNSLTRPQRSAQIQALAAQAKSEITRSLGAEAADAYAQRSPWMNMLQNGMAYSSTPPEGSPGSFFPGGGQSVYPVLPAGPTPAGTQRQFVINATAPLDGAVSHDTLVTGGNVQVMSFGVSSSTDPANVPADGTAPRRIINVAPGGTAGAPTTSTPTPTRPGP